MIVFIAEWP